MRRRLPPLTALRAFEAVARHASFKSAAYELDVTQSAISHQIRVLEENLGVTVFRRLPTGIELTAQGQHLFPAAKQAFDQIATAIVDMRGGPSAVMVHCSSSFAVRWLLPRAGRFEQLNPDIGVRYSSGPSPEALYHDLLDIEIVYETDGPSNAKSNLLVNEWLWPICSPDYLGGARIRPSEVLEHRLLVNSPDEWDWAQWGKSVGIDTATMAEATGKGMVFFADSAAIETAIAGQGIALSNLSYIRSDLVNGLLVPAVDCEPFLLGGHYMVERRSPSKAHGKFAKWLQESADDEREELEALFTLVLAT